MELTRGAGLQPIRYTSFAQLLVDFASAVGTGSDVVCFSDVPRDVFETNIQSARDQGKLQHRKARLTYIACGLVLITIPSQRHEVAQVRLTAHMERQGGRMGLVEELSTGGASKVAVGTSKMEPDGCYSANGLGNNPTVVIEVASSQSAGMITIKGAV